MKNAPIKIPATAHDVVDSLDAVHMAEQVLKTSIQNLKKARNQVRESRAELRRKKRFSKRAYKAALKRKPIR